MGRPVLAKYARELAAQTLEEVFKVNPNHPDAHAAMAGGNLETTYDLAAVRHHLDAALAVNPQERARAPRARRRSRSIATSGTRRRRRSAQVLAINTEDLEAIAMKATIAWLRDDTKAYEAEKAKAFAINPTYAELYRIVSRSAVREHRYVEAIELEKEAIKLKPDFYEAMAGAGLGYLRLGMEKEGLEWLDKAWKGDEYNVRTVQHAQPVRGRRSRRSTRSTRRRTSRSATTTTRSRRSRATSSRRWSARSPTW